MISRILTPSSQNVGTDRIDRCPTHLATLKANRLRLGKLDDSVIAGVVEFNKHPLRLLVPPTQPLTTTGRNQSMVSWSLCTLQMLLSVRLNPVGSELPLLVIDIDARGSRSTACTRSDATLSIGAAPFF